MRITLVLSFIIFAISLGCTKKRPEVDQQGQITDLQKITEINGKTFELQTGQQIARADSSNAEELKVDKELESINDFGFVEYETKAELMKPAVPFRGKENSKFTIRYHVDSKDRKLVVLKEGPKSLMPHDELMFAVEEYSNDETVAIPLVGYKIIGFYRIEKKLNSDREKTNTSIEVREEDMSKATHIRVDLLNKVPFKDMGLKDLYPAKYFSGEWFYAETVVATDFTNTHEIGNSFQGLDTNFSLATRIKFIPTRNYLMGVNLNIDDRLEKDELNFSKVIQIPVDKWVDKDAINHPEATILNPKVKSQFWNEQSKTSVELRFEKAVAVSDALSGSVAGMINSAVGFNEKKLVDLQFAKDYFAFTLYNPLKESRVKHAFFRAGSRNYKARTYPENDMEKFGYFSGKKSQIINYQLHRREDIFKNRFLGRFNPESKEIVYHLTRSSLKSSSDQWLLEVARSAVAHWDKAFAEAGTGIRIRLDESQKVEVGDIRYNSINFIQSTAAHGLGGLGPMLIDPMTGEIISATSNIHVTTYLSGITDQIRSYIKNKLGYYDGAASTLDLSNKIFADSPGPSGAGVGSAMSSPLMFFDVDNKIKVSESGGLLDRENRSDYTEQWFKSDSTLKLRAQIEKLDGQGKIRNVADLYKRKQTLLSYLGVSAHNPFQEMGYQLRGAKATHVLIEENCPQVVEYVESLKLNKADPTTKDENSVAEPCAQKLSRGSLIGVAVHEMGHNFGLMHNFKGSADKNHYFTADEIEDIYEVEIDDDQVVKSSAVMDYVPGNRAVREFPGKYEIAAIRYGYANEVETRNGMAVVKEGQDLDAIYSKFGEPENPYLYCHDGMVEFGLHPMCQRHDYGENPLEVVDNIIDDFYDSLVTRGYRYDQMGAPSGDGFAHYQVIVSFIRLRRFYDQWRFYLREVMPDKAYLEGLNSGEYAQLLNGLLAPDPQTGKVNGRYHMYKKVRDKIFDFFTSIAFLPNRYCVVRDRNGQLDAIELDSVRTKLKLRGISQGVGSCSAPNVAKVIGSKGFTLVKEIGHPLADMRFSLSDKDITDPHDIIGLGPLRGAATGALMIRYVGSLLHIEHDFFPNMMDEPDLRNRFHDLMMARTLNGTDLGTYVKDDLSEGESLVVKDFIAEKDLLLDQFAALKISTFVPGNITESLARYQTYLAEFTNKPVMTQGFEVNLRQDNGFILAQPHWTATVQMINQLEKIKSLMDAKAAGPDNLLAVEKVLMKAKEKITELGTPVTPGKLNEVIGVLGAAVQAGEIKESDQPILGAIFYPEMTIIANTIQPIGEQINRAQQAGEDPAALIAEFDRVASQDVTALYENFEGVKPLNAAEVDARFKVVKAQFDAQQAQASSMTSEQQQELEGQKDLLNRIMRFDATQVMGN